MPPKDIFNVDDIGNFTIRGNCHPDCFEASHLGYEQYYEEINLHSIIELGSKNVEKMKILKLTNGTMRKPCENCKRDGFAVSSRKIASSKFDAQTRKVTRLFITRTMLTAITSHSK